uniref:Transmembrane protein n=1 Tax=Ascaris lumbricoides TaxID=6252 RepID=A0A0M3I1D0_ASCLU
MVVLVFRSSELEDNIEQLLRDPKGWKLAPCCPGTSNSSTLDGSELDFVPNLVIAAVFGRMLALPQQSFIIVKFINLHQVVHLVVRVFQVFNLISTSSGFSAVVTFMAVESDCNWSHFLEIISFPFSLLFLCNISFPV